MCEHPGRGKGGGGSKGGNRRRSVHSDFGNLGFSFAFRARNLQR